MENSILSCVLSLNFVCLGGGGRWGQVNGVLQRNLIAKHFAALLSKSALVVAMRAEQAPTKRDLATAYRVLAYDPSYLSTLASAWEKHLTERGTKILEGQVSRFAVGPPPRYIASHRHILVRGLVPSSLPPVVV